MDSCGCIYPSAFLAVAKASDTGGLLDFSAVRSRHGFNTQPLHWQLSFTLTFNYFIAVFAQSHHSQLNVNLHAENILVIILPGLIQHI